MPLVDEKSYRELYSKESVGSYGAFGIKIFMSAHPRMPDMQKIARTANGYKAMELLEYELLKEVYANDPEAQKHAQEQRERLTQHCFGDQPVFVEDLPNGYCRQGCCAHLPWFKVTTAVGPIVIGWRKRVINIDWSETKGTKTAEELFPKEDTTKETRLIHAWTYEKARAYTDAIISGKPIA